jgi:hypothetical protein
MAVIAWADVVNLDATLSAVPVALQNVILARVETLSGEYFGGADGPVYTLARILLAGHLGLTLGPAAAGGAGTSGPVTSRSEGGVSESYAVSSSATSGAHSGTRHGLAFDALVRAQAGQIGMPS